MALGATAVVMAAYGAGPERKTKVLLLLVRGTETRPSLAAFWSRVHHPSGTEEEKNRPGRFSAGPPLPSPPQFCSLFRYY
ncbi:hypothetical protein LY76DRAFT_595379 [Colletotrichum caudatum]|nr:hypothetical protein LY76DRAFT_595379 [Colletotrichum caudatum]